MTKKWSNTVLVAFSALPKIVKELDFAFNSRLKSSFGSIHLKNGVSTLKLVEEMVEINSYKSRLALLKVCVCAALERLSADERSVLTARIIEKKTFQEISDMSGMSLRTVFRKFDRAQENFAKALSLQGLDEEAYLLHYDRIPALRAVSERLVGETYFVAKSN